MNTYEVIIENLHEELSELRKRIYELEKDRNSWKEQCLGKHNDPKDCPSWYDWCNCGGELCDRIEHLQSELKKEKEVHQKTAKQLVDMMAYVGHLEAKGV